MYTHMNGKVAVITGGSRGIGKAISLGLARQGCDIAFIYLSDHQSAKMTEMELQSCGVRAHGYQCHLGDKSSLSDFWEAFDKDFPQVDFLFANAATGVHRPVRSLTSHSLSKVFAVNVGAFIFLANEGIKRMPSANHLPGEKGRIVTLSSLGAERVIDDYASVGASKAALESLTRQYACECGPSGINVNCIRAGLVDTGVLKYIQGRDKIIEQTIQRTPNGRLVEVDDVADLALFLVSRHSAMINGQVITLDGGYSLPA